MSEDREAMAGRMENIAEELRLAAKHASIASDHCRSGEIPRFTAHLFAAQGHLRNVDEQIADAAKFHATKASVE